MGQGGSNKPSKQSTVLIKIAMVEARNTVEAGEVVVSSYICNILKAERREFPKQVDMWYQQGWI